MYCVCDDAILNRSSNGSVESSSSENIINLPADFTQPEDEKVKKIGEITASYSGGTFKIDGEEFSEMPDRIGSGYIESNTNSTDQSEADFQKMGDNFNIFVICYI